MKRHHDHNNIGKGKHLFVLVYSFRSLVLYDHGKTWWYAEIDSVKEGVKSSTSWSTGTRRRDCVLGTT